MKKVLQVQEILKLWKYEYILERCSESSSLPASNFRQSSLCKMRLIANASCKIQLKDNVFHPIIPHDYVQFWNGSSWEGGNCLRACNIDIVNLSLRSWHRIKRRIAQSTTRFGDPRGNSYGERNIPVGGRNKYGRQAEAKKTLASFRPKALWGRASVFGKG